jgi:hypothetical protein
MEKDIQVIKKNIEELIYFAGVVNERYTLLSEEVNRINHRLSIIAKETKKSKRNSGISLVLEFLFVSLWFFIIFI